MAEASARRASLASAAVAACLVVTGCAGMPSHGAVHLGRTLPAAGGLADPDVRVLPPAWQAGMSPAAVVTGFLHALVNDDDDYAIARSFLTATASAGWRPETGVTTYDDSELHTEVGTAPGVRVQVAAPRLGEIDRRGSFSPAPGTVRAAFTMSKSAGNWRIDRLSDGVLLSAGDTQRSFRLAEVYFFNRAGTRLVPTRLFLRDSTRGIATAVMTALIAGPPSWIAPAVRSAVPPDTSLIGNVPVHDNGIADVNLSSSVRSLSTRDLSALSAQIVWTLRQVAGVTAVRLLSDGAPLLVSGRPARQPVTSWPQFDPAAPAASPDVLFVRQGSLRTTGADHAALAASNPGRVQSAARTRAGDSLAVVQSTGAGARLLVGRWGGPLAVRLTAPTMTTPTFDVDSDAVTVVTGPGGRRLVAISPDGHRRNLSAEPMLLAQPVLSLRISPDGARVAAVVGSGRLLVGRVAGRGDSESFGGFRAIAPGLHQVRGVAWSGPDTIVVTAAAGAAQRQVVETDADGYSSRVVALPGVAGAPVDVAAAAGRGLVVATTARRMWIDDGGWRRLGPGSAPVYSG